ncbi:MAG: FG-GAP repeat protein [Planctomycetes bacterium]|nr:FG-GAP repeat protein [Planctomycetota bacterium]
MAHLQPFDAAQGFGSDFGRAVAISGDWIAVGAPDDDQFADESGAVYVFRRDGTRWVYHEKLKGLILAGDNMGYSVAMHGDWIVAGAPNFPSLPGSPAGLGRAYIFRRDRRGAPENATDDVWNAVAVLNPPPSQLCCNFGVSLDIAANVVVVGRKSRVEQIGSAYVFRYNGVEWLPDGVLVGSDTDEGDSFGRSVATNGSAIVVGAPRDDDAGDQSGSAYVFEKKDGEWVQTAKLLSPDPGPSRAFGASIAADGPVLVVTPHVFRSHGMEWLFEATLRPVNESGAITSDGPVAVSKGEVLIGSHLFGQTKGQWQQTNELTVNPSEFLRSSVSVDGDFAVSGGFNVFVHRICDGCGTLREFAALQNCMYQNTAKAPSCGAVDFSADAAINLADYAEFLGLLVGP